MVELIKLNREWFDSIFVSIKPWSVARLASHKEVWVRCYVLPISLWNKDCFARVVGETTTLISIDNATLLWENLQYARLKIRLEIDRYVRVAKKMKINDHLLSIFIIEEFSVFTFDQCNGSHNNYESSHSISSSETYVQQSVFSVGSGEEERAAGLRRNSG